MLRENGPMPLRALFFHRPRLLAASSALAVMLLPLAARPDTRNAMGAMLVNLQVLLPLSADPKRFADPMAKDDVEAALEALAATATVLDEHGKGFDPGGRFLVRSLARDARRAHESYEAGEFARAQYSVRQIVSGCVGCHSAMDSPKDSPLAADFLRRSRSDALPPLERARLQIATRRFDDALASFEEAFDSVEAPPPGLMAALVQYLAISVRVKGDLARPVPVLERVAAIPGVWPDLRDTLGTWVRALRDLQDRSPSRPTVDDARRILEEGKGLARYPADRRPLVHRLLASRVLIAVVTAPTPVAEGDRGEAYYLLGAAEARIGPDFWRSRAEFYLEQAILLAPGSPTARHAYERLEEETEVEYSGSGGERIPPRTRKRLDELRALAFAGARPARDGP